jgi:type I restriction enzyme S subunit
MAGEWQECPLSELTENFDSIRVPVKEADRQYGPYPYYGASGIVDYVDRFLFDGEYLLIAEDGENLRTRNTPVAFLARGKFWVNNHAHILRGNEKADTRFLMYALASRDINGFLTGSTMPKLTQGNMNRIPIPAPSLPTQRAIAHILGTLDDKIELNRRMNETLEATARAIFKSWFVDFDPVRAKAEGRKPQGMDTATADLFPSEFEDSALGKVPKGWRVAALQDVLKELETGSRPKGGVGGITEGVPSVGAESIVGLGKFDFGKTKRVPREFFDDMKKGHVRSRDVLLYKDGGRPGEYEPHVSMFGDGFPFEEFCINEHVYRLRTNDLSSQSFLYFWLTSDLVMDEMRVKGTGVAIPGLNSTAVRSLATLIPGIAISRAFSLAVEGSVGKILHNCNESRTLAALRDALLPKLLSGELRVRDAERFVTKGATV